MSSADTKVVVVGAGAVGSTLAYALQTEGLAREIVLIDKTRELAEGHALDLNHGKFFAPAVRVRSGGYEDCEGADVAVITAGAAQEPGQSRLDLVDKNLQICRSVLDGILEHTRRAVLLVVTNPVDVLTYAALQYSGLPREQIIGSGTVLDSARFRYLLSEQCAVYPPNVHGYVLGEHGDSEMIPWSMVHFSGIELEHFCRACPRRCDPNVRANMEREVRESAYHVIGAKGVTNWAVSRALVRIISAILRDERSLLTVSTLLRGEYGIEDVCLSVPLVLARGGVERMPEADLTAAELEALRGSAEAIREVLRDVGLQ